MERIRFLEQALGEPLDERGPLQHLGQAARGAEEETLCPLVVQPFFVVLWFVGCENCCTEES